MRVVIPATTANLGPGFDCLGLALNLHNELDVNLSDTWWLNITGEGADELPTDQSNLLWTAACSLWKEVGMQPPNVCINMHNRIPLGRGLGSSAAAIVGGLAMANALASNPLSRDELIRLATEIEGHPDNVAPAILGGFTASTMQGQQVVTARLPFPDKLQVVACVPYFQLATEKARAALPLQVAHGDAVFNLSRVAILLAALMQERWDMLEVGSQDCLHQPYRAALIPGFGQVQQAARAAGASAVVVSGAGPSILALLAPDEPAEVVGSAMQQAFRAAGLDAHYHLLRPELRGALVHK